jgi:hypothetical protein
MNGQTRCHCRSCTIRSLMGPAVVITVGVLFLLHQTQGGRYYFGNTWPILLLVIGAVQLASSLASHDGHIVSSFAAAVPPPAVRPPSVPPPVVPPPVVPQAGPYPGQEQ